MTDEKKYTESEAQLFFAKRFHGCTWELLDKPIRSQEEDEMMLDFAHTSLAHWRSAGTAVNHQRGAWMLARVYTVLGEVGLALRYARRTRELTDQFKAEMADFDLAFAHECMARAQALAGDKSEALKYLALAQKAGEAIQDEEDRKVG